jgi:hypothetical protein
VATQSGVWVCDHSLAAIAGSNPAGGMDVWPLWVLCVLSEVSVMGRLFIWRSSTVRGVSECDWGTSQRRHRTTRAVTPQRKELCTYLFTPLMPTQYCCCCCFCLVGAKHKFDFMFVVNRTLTNSKKWKVMKTDFFDNSCMFSPETLFRDRWPFPRPHGQSSSRQLRTVSTFDSFGFI